MLKTSLLMRFEQIVVVKYAIFKNTIWRNNS